mgnify:FL=1
MQDSDMEKKITEPATYQTVSSTLKTGAEGETFCCTTEASFDLAKVALVKEKLSGITVQLLDQDGYAVRQVTSKRRGASPAPREALSDRQIKVVKALEKVLMHCKKEGIQLVGYSDELVALPASVSEEDISAASAVDVNCYGTYRGADAIFDTDTN